MNNFCGKCGSPLVNGKCPKCDPAGVDISKEKKAKETKKAPEKLSYEKEPAKKKGKGFLWVLSVLVVIFTLLCLHLYGVVSIPFLGPDTLAAWKANKQIEPETETEETESESESEAQESELEWSSDDGRIDAEEYYNQNALVLSKETASQSAKLYSEAGVIAELQSRGFAELGEMYAEFSVNGEVIGIDPITQPSDEKHPTYTVLYYADNGNIWSLQIVEDQIMAYPVFYMWENEAEHDILLVEDSFTKTYDSITDTFFTVKPNEDAVLTIPVNRVDAETLNDFTSREISDYE